MNSSEKKFFALPVSAGVAFWHIYFAYVHNELSPLSEGLKYAGYVIVCVVIIGWGWVRSCNSGGLAGTYIVVTFLFGTYSLAGLEMSSRAATSVGTMLHLICLGPLAFWGFILVVTHEDPENPNI